MAAVRSSRRQIGQVLIIVAFAMPVLFAMLALLVDLGFVYSFRERVRAGADAGALGGAKAIARGLTDPAVLAAINQYVAANGGTLDMANAPPYYVDQNGNNLGNVGGGSLPSGAVGVEVDAKMVINSFFGGLLGKPVLPIGMRSRAIAAYSDVIPFDIPHRESQPDGPLITYVVGNTYWIEGANLNWESYGSDRGDWGLIDYRNGSSATEMRNDIFYGYRAPIQMGGTYIQAHMTAQAVRQGIQWRLGAGTTTVVLSIADLSTEKQGNSFKKIVKAFAVFSIDTPENRSVDFDGTNVNGVYLGGVATNGGYKLVAPSVLP